jgi:hypothetical protein
LNYRKACLLLAVLIIALLYSLPVLAAEPLSVQVAVVGPEGELIFGSRSVTIEEGNKWGATALGALEATALAYGGIEYSFGYLVNSIDGKTAEGTAGWMYTLNDLSPSVGADSCEVAEGDIVIWYYSATFGTPAPKWAELNEQISLEPVDLQEALSAIVSYYREHRPALGGWEEVLALWGAGVDLGKDPWQLPSWEIDQLDKESSVNGYASTILGMIAGGIDPAKSGGRNLPAELAARQNADGSFGEGWLNEHFWSVIALDTVGEQYDAAGAVEYLMDQQKGDGGFTLFGDMGDPDMTAMALIALVNHRHRPGVEEAIAAALGCLKGLQLPNGGFSSWGENAESSAVVIRALVACGKDPAAAPWSEGSRSVIHALFAYQLGDGSFSHHIGEGSDAMATSQALIAVGDLLTGSLFERLAASYQAGFPESESESGEEEGAPQPVDGEEQQGKGDLPATTGGGALAASLGLVLLSLGVLFTCRTRCSLH